MRSLCYCMTFVFGSAFSLAQAESEWKTIRSSSRGFVLTGTNTADLLRSARWAETVADRIERSTRVPIRFGAQREFRILIRSSDEDSGLWKVETGQEHTRDVLVQKLLIENPDRIDWESALESLSRLLLLGYVADRQARRGQSRQTPDAPAWLTVGLAQHLDPALRLRNRKIALHLRQEDGLPSFLEVLQWQALPDGRQREKAVCGMAFAWLQSLPDARPAFEAIFSRLAAGEPVSGEWLGRNVLGCDSVVDMERKWAGRISREDSVITDIGAVTVEQICELRNSLVVRKGSESVPADAEDLPPVAGFSSLPRLRKASWIPAFCAEKRARLSIRGIGRPEEFVAIIRGYCRFLDALAAGRKETALVTMLAEADSALDDFEELTRKRKSYMDGAEQRLVPESRLPAAAETGGVDVARSELQRYIDDAEKRLGGAGAGKRNDTETTTDDEVTKDAQDNGRDN